MYCFGSCYMEYQQCLVGIIESRANLYFMTPYLLLDSLYIP
jgi:hypothetical protein